MDEIDNTLELIPKVQKKTVATWITSTMREEIFSKVPEQYGSVSHFVFLSIKEKLERERNVR